MVRFGIVGTNTISEWFAGACRATDGRAEAVAVCSRDVGRARAFADKVGATDAFADLATMAESVDAVYIASPNGCTATRPCWPPKPDGTCWSRRRWAPR